MARAKATGEPVVADALTTETRLVTADPDTGNFVAELSAAPARVQRGGEWHDIDPTLVVNEAGELVPAMAAVDFSLSRGGSGPLVDWRLEDGSSWGLTWPGDLPEPVVDGTTATYSEVLPGVDLTVKAGAAGLSTYVVIKTREAAANPAVDDLSFGVEAHGVTVADDGDGGSVVTTPAGEVLVRGAQPRMWDATGHSGSYGQGSQAAWVRDLETDRTRPLGLSVADSRVHLSPSRAFLDSPNTEYPVVIDPDWSGWSQDSVTESAVGMVWDNGQDFYNASTQELRVGYDGWSDNKVSRVFLKFPIGDFQVLDPDGDNRVVLGDAQLHMRQVHSPEWTCNDTNPTGPTVKVFRADGFGPAITWPGPNTYNLQDDVLRAHGHRDYCFVVQQDYWNVLSALQDAVNEGQSNLILAVKSGNEQHTSTAKYGWRIYKDPGTWAPKLDVIYNTKPLITKVDLTASTTCASGSNSDPYYTNQTRPYVQVKATDPDGSTLTYHIRVKDQSGTVVATKSGGPFAAGTLQTLRVDAVDSLDVDGPYTVEARADDGVHWSKWSSAVNLVVDTTPPAEKPTMTAAGGDPVQVKISYGQKARFRFASTETELCRFDYGFTTSGHPLSTPSGHPYWVDYWPASIGPDWVEVVAVDYAGNTGPAATADFRVNGRLAAHTWSLDGAVPDTTAADVPGVDADGNPLAALDWALTGVAGWSDGRFRFYSVPGQAPIDWAATDRALDTGGLGYGALDNPNPFWTETVDPPTDAGDRPMARFSVSAWVKPAATANWTAVVSGVDTTQQLFSLSMDNSQPQRWRFSVEDSASPGVDIKAVGPEVVTGEWTHLVGVVDVDKTGTVVRLYVNGVEALPAAQMPNGLGLSPIAVDQVFLGRNNPTVSAIFFNGLIDDVRWFPGALDPVAAWTLAHEVRDQDSTPGS